MLVFRFSDIRCAANRKSQDTVSATCTLSVHIDRSINWSVVESLSQPVANQSALSQLVCHKSLTLSLSHAAWLSLCHPSSYQSATIFATSSNIRSVAQSVCNQSVLRVPSPYHGKSCAMHVAVAHAVYLSRALEMSIHLTLTLSVALILSRALSTRTQICLSMTHLCVYHSHSCCAGTLSLYCHSLSLRRSRCQ